jgi:1,4-dihydroxy-2-naphthoate octaprenyltransferase
MASRKGLRPPRPALDVIALALMSSATGIALVMGYGGGLPILLALAALYGAFSLTIYSLCVVAHVNDIADYERFVEVASGTLLMYGIGATAGPLIASA